MKKKVCLFGSSVNPPTRAHVSILEHFSSSHSFDEVWLLPVYKHIYASKSKLNSFDKRLQMCHLAINGLDRVLVMESERIVFQKFNKAVKKPIPIGTYDVLTHLYKTYEDTEFHFVLGADAYVDLCKGKWKNGEQIVKMVGLEVIQRDDKPTTAQLKKLKFGERASFHKISTIDSKVSSTKARALRNVDELKEIVPDKVAIFIAENSLYGFANTTPTARI